MVAVNQRPLLHFATAAEWEAWLHENPGHDGIRLQLRKKSSDKPGMLYAEALDVALCWGWIDGQAGSIDEDFYYHGFSPRRTRSPWSQINREHVARLTAEGRMRPGGLAEVERAKADGRWDAAYSTTDTTVPEDLQRALDASPAALEMFGRLTAQNRFAILSRVKDVKRAETRARRIVNLVAMLERGETLYPQRR